MTVTPQSSRPPRPPRPQPSPAPAQPPAAAAPRRPWLHSPWAYSALVLLVVLLPYPFQQARHRSSRIFDASSQLNRDASEWLAIAATRPFLSEAAPMRVARPLYPFPAYVVRHTLAKPPSALTTYRLLNLAWFLVAALALRWWTLHWTQDPSAALAAGVLFASSFFVQVYLSQPMPEMLAAAVSIGVLCLAARASGWQTKPSRPLTRQEKVGLAKKWKPWVVVGALTALLMLGKDLYALYLVLLLIGLVRRAWKPLFAFAAAALTVHLLYIVWVKWGLGRPYSPYGSNQQGFVSWIFDDLIHRPLKQQALFLVRLAERIGLRTAQAFWYWPIVAAVVGWFVLRVRPRALHLLAFLLAYFVLFLATNIVTPRIAFQCFFPLILPASGAGIVWILGKIGARYGRNVRTAWRVVLALALLSTVVLDPFWFFYFG